MSQSSSHSALHIGFNRIGVRPQRTQPWKSGRVHDGFHLVRWVELKVHLTRGQKAIAPAPETCARMRADHANPVCSVKLCVSAAGRVQSTAVLQSSGYRAWDIELVRNMDDWRFEPFEHGGKPVPVCTVVTFVCDP